MRTFLAGSLSVPNDTDVVSLNIQSLHAGDYALAFSATGMYMGNAVPCVSNPVSFTIVAGQTLTLPAVTLLCTIQGGQTDDTGGFNASVSVQVETITVANIVETFIYAPSTSNGHLVGGACVYQPISLQIANTDPSISYSWSATPDGSFTGTALNGTYVCASGGSKSLTLTATMGSTTLTKSITVTCDDTACGYVCGNGTVEPGEQCDEVSQRCANCQIVPTCGDGVVDAPEQCDSISPPLPTSTCDINCHTISQAVCGNGVKEGTEQCDNGTANSDTAADACRTNCTNATCGDGVVDTGEQCDGGSACDANCQTVVTAKWPACLTCLNQDIDTSYLQSAYCTSQACVDIEACVVNSGCYLPVSAACYCGPDTSANCEDPNFVPTGACAGLIRAATGNLTNAETLTAAQDFSNASGQALLVLSEASQPTNTCVSTCF